MSIAGAEGGRQHNYPFNVPGFETRFHQLLMGMTREMKILRRHGRADTVLLFILLCTVSIALVLVARERVRMLDELAFHWGGGVLPARSEPHVVVILQPADCIQNTTPLQEMANLLLRGGLPVSGLLSVDRRQGSLTRAMIADSPLPFDLTPVTAEYIAVGLQAIGIRSTPVVVLVDGDGRVRYLAPFEEGNMAARVELFLQLSATLE